MVDQNLINIRRLTLISLLLTIVVIGLGAYTRLTHAGLGCPDWPTCYGLINVPETSHEIAIAEQAFPERPVETAKAWNEMIHRYFAGALGALIALIAMLCIKLRLSNKVSGSYPLFLPLTILCVVVLQAALGMWTVTLKLMPIVVMGHLLGGFTTLCLLFLLFLRINNINPKNVDVSQTEKPANNERLYFKRYTRFTFLGISILTVQIALGGWTSSNYAAMSCVELPICQGNWLDNLSFEQSFNLIPPAKDSYEFGHLPHNERLTIHVAHRIGAMITTVFLLWLATMLYVKVKTLPIKRAVSILLTLLTIQVSLGVSNIWFSLPLKVAVSHNVFAALLMLSLIYLVNILRQSSQEYLYE